ncbi:MAG TPA: protease inhibitor I42 family protein [Bacillota bacterium]|nr:protease inhibitor I42 family protein [Bacillota bacterium]
MSEQLEATVGQPLQITLQSMVGSTGYGWYLSQLNGGVVLSSAEIQATAPGIAPVNHIFNFLAVEAGTFDLAFQLIAPWRPGEPGNISHYEVVVKNPES